MECQRKSNENTPSFTLYFKFSEYFLKKNVRYSHQIFYFLFYISFYISRHHVSQILKFIEHYLKKDFHGNFSLLHPLNGQNLLSVTKVFCRHSLYIANMNQESSSRTVLLCVHCTLLVCWWLWNLSYYIAHASKLLHRYLLAYYSNSHLPSK